MCLICVLLMVPHFSFSNGAKNKTDKISPNHMQIVSSINEIEHTEDPIPSENSTILASSVDEPARTSIPFTENFNASPWSGGTPTNWSKEFISGTTNWVQYNGCLYESPLNLSGDNNIANYNALFYQQDWSEPETRLITPVFDFGAKTANAKLKFYHAQREWDGDQDELYIYYRIPVWDSNAGVYTGTWNLLTSYTESIPNWVSTTIELPSVGSRYQIAFKGYAYYGYGVGLDEVSITGFSQATGVQFANILTTQMDVNWTRGDGDKCVIFIAQASSGSASPVDSVSYTANTTFQSGSQIGSSGWYCVYNGTGTGVTVSGLSEATTYRVQVCEYSGTSGLENYAYDAATDNPDNQTTASTVTFTDGSLFSSTAMIGSSDQVLGRFNLTANTSGASLTAASIKLNGVRTGLSNIKLWSSADASYGSDTQLGSAVSSDPGNGNSVTFNGFSSGISTGGGTYYFFSGDVAESANGAVQGIIVENSNLTLSGGVFSGSISNAILSSSETALPIELVQFTARLERQSIILKWITESETENVGYIIERQKNNSDIWVKLADYQSHEALRGQGTTSCAHNYIYHDTDIEAGETYAYRLSDVSENGNIIAHPSIDITMNDISKTGIEKIYPNPFNPQTYIAYSLLEDADVKIRVVDIFGRLVKTLQNGDQTSGSYHVYWNGNNDKNTQASSGMYFIHMQTDKSNEIQKVVLMK